MLRSWPAGSSQEERQADPASLVPVASIRPSTKCLGHAHLSQVRNTAPVCFPWSMLLTDASERWAVYQRSMLCTSISEVDWAEECKRYGKALLKLRAGQVYAVLTFYGTIEACCADRVTHLAYAGQQRPSDLCLCVKVWVTCFGVLLALYEGHSFGRDLIAICSPCGTLTVRCYPRCWSCRHVQWQSNDACACMPLPKLVHAGALCSADC